MEDLKGVVIIGATNRPDIIDEALLRPGRFDRLLEIPIPDKYARKQILQIYLKKKPLGADVNIDKLVNLTDRYTGAEIEALVNAAAIASVREYIIAKEQKSNKEKETNTEPPSGMKEKYDNDKKEEEEELEISMKHFKSSLSKIAKKNTPSLYTINSVA